MLSITLVAPWANMSTLLVLLFITTKSGAGFPVKLQWTSNFLFCMTSVLSTKNPVIEAGSAVKTKFMGGDRGGGGGEGGTGGPDPP